MRDIVSPLDGIRSPFGQRRTFNPLSLFAAGEVGAWYDPSDFSSMFETSGGTIAASLEAPVGLILDKSKSLALGSELVTDPLTYTAIGTGTWVSNGDGSYTFTDTVGGQSRPGVQFATAGANKWYDVRYTLVSTSAQMRVTTLSGGVTTNSSTPGTYRTIQLPTGNTGAVQFRFETTSTTLGWSFTISNISVRQIAGNHAYQTTSASRPVLKIDSNNCYYLLFDGTDDSLATSAIDFSATDKMSVFAGVRKLSDAASGCIVELSATSDATNSGSFGLFAPYGIAANFGYSSRGTFTRNAAAVTFTSPTTAVLTGASSIAEDICSIRVNAAAGATQGSDQGTGNYGAAYPLYIGRRGGTTFPFNGRLYSLIVRGKASTATEITNAETWVNSKTKAY